MDGVVAIDLGFPKGDFLPEVANKAGFFTPVPGGVGPVTIACLYENLALTTEIKLEDDLSFFNNLAEELGSKRKGVSQIRKIRDKRSDEILSNR